ncbi:NADP-dependent malic enzyme [Iodidimonas muriae]|uniref:NADP-dependent malic enzyme n=1 Tax=Iodidimonas muriae TaxID=261467 RepID=A0ABQ2L9L1_9PROT|nr:NADP-dependent malic enzyme [Iodidimonas muriae]GER05911.1 NADP-dependent malic enzyme [Kordiimonadales bacterium JCM 17843]GGO07388.1 NADP-dependent malic enzyme [Iodidimonas muriae]
MSDNDSKFSDREALRFHSFPKPGKIEITATKPMATQRDLSLAYSPGVAVPVKAIAENPDCIFDYTARGNLVAVISNGTAILGLGNLGAAASKPVMEGKAVLFKRFADIDAIDIELNSEDVDAIVNAVSLMEPSFGGINLEDIGAPACFIIEQRLRELMDIPVFHDDQHGTAIITAAGFLNAIYLTGRDTKKVRVVMNGAGAAAIACAELLKALGVLHENLIMCDSKGVIHTAREDTLNQWKSAHAIDTEHRTLADAIAGADVFIGLSVKGAVNREMVKSMAAKPIIFAMANPDPEISPEDVAEVRDDAIMATGRSDYPNQVNNVLGFPYIFRGALDVRARTINEEMKVAAAHALAELARSDVPDEVAAAYSGRKYKFGPHYIIPAPFDPRLMEFVPPRVAQAAMDSGVARKPIEDMAAYRRQVSNRLNPTVGLLGEMYDMLTSHDKRVIFAEAEEDRMLRAAVGFKSGGYGTPILIGYEDVVAKKLRDLGADPDEFEIHSARTSTKNEAYTDWLYKRLQRIGYLKRDAQRLVNRDRNVFSACMLANGDADAMVTGLTRNYYQAVENIQLVIDPKAHMQPFGLTIVMSRERTVFIADTVMNERPTGEELADIAQNAAAAVRHLGHKPSVALLSFSNFGQPMREKADHVREAVGILEQRDVDFEFEGDMAPDTALNPDLLKLYPFARLSGPANVLVMPALHSANISTKLVGALGGAKVIGPILWGFERSVQIVRMGSHTSDVLNMAALAAVGSIDRT